MPVDEVHRLINAVDNKKTEFNSPLFISKQLRELLKISEPSKSIDELQQKIENMDKKQTEDMNKKIENLENVNKKQTENLENMNKKQTEAINELKQQIESMQKLLTGFIKKNEVEDDKI